MAVSCMAFPCKSIIPVAPDASHPQLLDFHERFGTRGCTLGCEARKEVQQIMYGRMSSRHGMTRTEQARRRRVTKGELNKKFGGYTKQQYFRSAQTGCGSCAIILSMIEMLFRKDDPNAVQHENVAYQLNSGFVLGEFDLTDMEQANLKPAQIADPKRQVQLFNIKGSSYLVQSLITANLLTGNTALEHSTNKLRDWLRDCCNNHGTCLYQGDFVTPTRLIDVNPVQRDGREGVRLVESCSHNPEPYIAVSHCWGKAPIACCTTRNNIAEQYDIIDWQVLTKNFQDAITITRALNVRYIWIDSLCIIQGDKADWDAESSKMDTVYQQAYLTIAISSSADSTGGCFSSTYPDLCFQIDDGTHEKLTLGARCCDTLGLLQFSPEIRSRFPLFTRAWVFQERLLSRRILYCNYGEFAFQCLTTQTCECEKSNIAPHSTSREFPGSMARPHHREIMAKLSRSIRNGRGQIWREIVADYLPNDLTRQADILPALSGCARIIGEWYGDEYIAGMWKSSLHVDLLWDNNKPYTEILKRKKEWTAPTWSWASLRSGQLIEFQGSRQESQKTTMRYFLKDSIVDIKLELDGDGTNKYGVIKSASLKVDAELSTFLLRRRCKVERHTKSHKYRYDAHVTCSKTEKVACESTIPAIDLQGGTILFKPDVDLAGEDLTFEHLPGCKSNSFVRPKDQLTVTCAIVKTYLLRLGQKVKAEQVIDVFMVLRRVNEASRTYARLALVMLDSHTPEQRGKWFREIWQPNAVERSIITLI